MFCALEQNATLPLLIALEEKFTCRLSLSNADKGATGLKTDRLYESLYPLNPRLSGLGCTSHRVNSAQKAQMEVCSETYAGTVAFSLAHKGDGSWAVFRRNSADILFESARPIYGGLKPSPDTPFMRRIDAVLTLALPSEPRNIAIAQRKERLRNAFQSPLDREEIDVYIETEPMRPRQERKYLKRWASQTADDLVPQQFSAMQRQRWVLNNFRVKQLMLMAVSWNVLKRAVARTFPSKTKTEVNTGWSSGDEPTAPKAQGNEKPEEKGSTSYWARKNEEARGDVRKWLQGESWLPMLILCSIAMEPHVHLLRHVLCVDGPDWEAKQVQALRETGKREWRLLLLHNLEMTAQFHMDCAELFFNEAPWSALPSAEHSCRSRSMAYSLVSRTLCAVWLLIEAPATGYPFKLFKLMQAEGDDLSALLVEILGDPECLHDPFSARFLALFATRETLGSPKVAAILMAIAYLLRITISRIECRHSAVRRLLATSGLTWLRNLSGASADWLMMRSRVIELAGAVKATSPVDPQAQPRAQGSEKKKRPQHGGPHKAFLSEFLQDGGNEGPRSRPRFQQAATAYNAIKVAGGPEWDRLVTKGRQATLLGRAGQPTFEGRRKRSRVCTLDLPEPTAPPEQAWSLEEDGFAIVEMPKDADMLVPFPLRHRLARIRENWQLANKQDRDEAKQRDVRNDAFFDAEASKTRWQQLMPFSDFTDATVRPRVGPSVSCQHDASFTQHQVVLPTSKMVDRFMANADAELKSELRKDFEERHRPREDSEVLARTSSVADSDSLPQTKLCFVAGFCVCKLPQLRACVQRLQVWLRRKTKKEIYLRTILSNGMLFLKFSQPLSSNRYIHLGFQNLTTWNCAVLEAQPHDDDTEVARAEAVGAIMLQLPRPVSNHFPAMNLWQLLRDTSFYDPIFVQLYHLDDSLQDIYTEFVPRDLKLVIADDEVYEVWGGEQWWRKLHTKRKSQTRYDGTWGRRPTRSQHDHAKPMDVVPGHPPNYALPLCDEDGLGADCFDDEAPVVGDDYFGLDDGEDHWDDVLDVLNATPQCDEDGKAFEGQEPPEDEGVIQSGDEFDYWPDPEGMAQGDDVPDMDDWPDLDAMEQGDGVPGAPINPSGPIREVATQREAQPYSDGEGWLHLPCGGGFLVCKPGDQQFYADCKEEGHQVANNRGNTVPCRCRRVGWRGRRRGQGRPLGFLTAWLFRIESCPGKTDHDDCKTALSAADAYVERRLARDWLKLQEWAEPLFQEERDVADSEDDSEPEQM